MRIPLFAILFCLLQVYHAAGQTPSSGEAAYTPVLAFDVKRDAAADISAAVAEAQRSRKRIILYVGGPWCPYCEQLEELFKKNPDIRNLRDAHFITVPIYIGSEKNNARALAPYAPILGIPHFFVLENNGSLLHSQHMLELRTDGEYSSSKMKEFLTRWSGSDDIKARVSTHNP